MSQSFDALDANYVLTLEEISNLTDEGSKPADTLMNVVALIATRFKTDVCSAYLLEPDRSKMVLAATLGLHPAVSERFAWHCMRDLPGWSPNRFVQCRLPM